MTTNGLSRRAIGPDDSSMTTGSGDSRAGIESDLVECLIAEQFPEWSHLPVAPAELETGHDKKTIERSVALQSKE